MEKLLCTFCLLLVCGCSTIAHGPYQDVVITSNPPGAIVTPIDYKCWVKTPGILKLERKNSTVLTARLRGYEDAKQKIQVKLSPWLLGNAVGWIPSLLLLDLSTGSLGVLSPTEVHFELVPKKKSAIF